MMINHVAIVSREKSSNSDNAFSSSINQVLLALHEKYGNGYQIHNIALASDGNTVLIHYSFSLA